MLIPEQLQPFSRRPEASLSEAEERIDLSRVPLIIPVGGLSTRAREITKDLIPKHLIHLNENFTILDFVCMKLQEVGFREFVFCVGYYKDQIIEHISKRRWILDEVNTRFSFSLETKPLGPDGATYHELKGKNYLNPVTIMPGDMFLPWHRLEAINRFHLTNGADITFGLTSVVTERTTDVGKILIEVDTNRLLKCYRRDEETKDVPANAIRLTSAGICVLNPQRYIQICEAYLGEYNLPDDSSISIRDNLLPWIGERSDYMVKGFDLEGEALDLGTSQNIKYGLENWMQYG